MPLTINSVTLAGRLTRDPETRQAADKAVCVFALALNRTWKDAQGETKEEVTFVDCEAWGRTAELIGQYLRKGSLCYLEGRLKLDRWKDDQGHDRQRMKVVVATVQFLDARRSDNDAGHTETPRNDDAPAQAMPSAPTTQRAPASRPQRPASRPIASAHHDDAPF